MIWKEPHLARKQRVKQIPQFQPRPLLARLFVALFMTVALPVYASHYSPRKLTAGDVLFFLLPGAILTFAFLIRTGSVLLYHWTQATYYANAAGLNIRRNRAERSLPWRNMIHLEILPHPTFENISLIQFVNRADQKLVEEVPFESGQIDAAAILELHRNGKSQPIVFPVVCRLKPSLWFTIFQSFAIVIFCLWGSTLPDYSPSPDTSQLILCFGVAMAAGIGGVWLTFEMIRAEIRADAVGLTWRNAFGGWKQVRWEEITDYYRKIYSNRGREVRIVETPVSKLELSPSFGGIDLVADLVLERASKVERLGWEDKKFGFGGLQQIK